MRSTYDVKLDNLSRKVSRCIEGDDLIDIATVFARMIVFAIYSGFDSNELRREAMDKLVDAMQTDLRRSIATDDHGMPLQ